MTKARIFATIAVHDPKGGLKKLPGVLASARRIASWARNHGYDVITIHDEKKPVTVARIRTALGGKIKKTVNVEGREIDRIVIYFSGHGLADSFAQSFWLLSNWQSDPSEAIFVSKLQGMLRYYNPKQLSLIGDACRSVTKDTIEIVGSAVLLRPDEEPQPLEVDQFFAAEAGEPAYAIPEADGKGAFCIFTEVLLDALEGEAEEALDTEIPGKARVTSQSLRNYLLDAVPIFAGKHGVVMKASPNAGFTTDRVYVEFASDGGTPWAPDDGLRTTKRITLAAARVNEAEQIEARDSVRAARERKAEETVESLVAINSPTHYETMCGLAVAGTPVAQVIALHGGGVNVDRPGAWYRVNADRPSFREGFVDLVVTFLDGRTAYVCALYGFIATLVMNAAGEASVIYRKIHESGPERDKKVLDIVARMNTGLLPREEAISVAAEIRYLKHADPSLGCIAAYLYDSIGDIDGVRKTASYYPECGQMIPLDIALLSGGRISMGADGALTVDIPATKKREARTDAEEKFGYTFEATDERLGARVAGLAPWMRGGWMAAETAFVDESAAQWRRRIRKLAPEMTASPFSVLKPLALGELKLAVGASKQMEISA